MFYLAIILVLTGIFVIVYSLSIEIKKAPKSDAHNNQKPIKSYNNKKNALTDTNETHNDATALEDDVLTESRIIPKVTDIDRLEEDKEDEIPDITEEPAPEIDPYKASVLCYEDSSTVIDYYNNTTTIDSTLMSYKHIKLIGKGTLTLENQGFNFHIGKTLRRFDFHAIQDMKSGGDFLALIPRKGPIKLFIIKENNSFIETSMNNFQINQKG